MTYHFDRRNRNVKDKFFSIYIGENGQLDLNETFYRALPWRWPKSLNTAGIEQCQKMGRRSYRTSRVGMVVPRNIPTLGKCPNSVILSQSEFFSLLMF